MATDERLTKDISDDFFPALCQVAEDLSTAEDSKVDPMHMMRVMMSESNVRANAHNDNPKSIPPEKRYNASGLIQFMPATMNGLGWFKGHAAFRLMTATQQLVYVRKYYTPYKGYLHTVGGLYTATFLPALVKHASNPDYVLTAKGGQLSWAYGPNAVFDANKDSKITVGELEAMVNRACKGDRWNQLVARLEGYQLSQMKESAERTGDEIDEPVTLPEVDDTSDDIDFECK